MAHLKRRILLAAGATVLATHATRKPAAADTPGVTLQPFSAIVPSNPPKPLPPVAFKTLDGVHKTLADFAGRAILLNFWATWCVPCVAELPELDKLAASDPNLSVLVASADRSGATAVKPFLAAHPITHATILLDQASDAVHALGVSGFPTTLLIDPSGHLRGTLEGPAAWSTAAATISALMRP
jgi:thiol-disulfide isomerase/thioredoxin